MTTTTIRKTRRRFLADGARAAAGSLLAVADGELFAVQNAPARRKRVILVWSEGTAPKSVYPNDINAAAFFVSSSLST